MRWVPFLHLTPTTEDESRPRRADPCSPLWLLQKTWTNMKERDGGWEDVGTVLDTRLKL